MPDKPRREIREQTDARLKAERSKTDEELARRTAATDLKADDVVRVARGRAEDVLRTARERADEKLPGDEGAAAERAKNERDRLRDDEVLRREYALADEIAADERAERARLVAELLAQERQDTDRGLLLERVDADAVISRRDEFLGMVSHDLRNELAAIAMSIAQILTRVSDDDAGRRIFRSATNIQRINLRMSRLIGDLLDVVSIDIGKFNVVPEEHDVCRTVEDIVESFAPIASAKGISLTVKLAEDALPARFDHQRIQQMLGNLLTNALKYTSEGGRSPCLRSSKATTSASSSRTAGPESPRIGWRQSSNGSHKGAVSIERASDSVSTSRVASSKLTAERSGPRVKSGVAAPSPSRCRGRRAEREPDPPIA